MSKIVIQTTDQGLSVPAHVLADAGIEPGQPVELAPLPATEEIVAAALRHVVKHLGDAIRVRSPQWDGSRWDVDLVSPDGRHVIGQLRFDAYGKIIAAESSTFESVRTSYDAARTSDTST
jgi:hypothetical protein